jgi:hypothetical protein
MKIIIIVISFLESNSKTLEKEKIFENINKSKNYLILIYFSLNYFKINIYYFLIAIILVI